MKEVEFSKSIRLPWFKVRFEKRSKERSWGRFGGGWNWMFGMQIGSSSIIINLLVMSIRIDRYITRR